MNIAIFSDSHDNIPNLEVAVSLTKERGITYCIHLGDLCSPLVVEYLLSSELTWNCVWGNNDVSPLKGYRVPIGSQVTIERSDFSEQIRDGRVLFLSHYPQIARMAAFSGKYDACFFGHNHSYSQEVIGITLLANPGEILGTRTKLPSFAVYNTSDNTFRRVLLSS